MNVIVKWGDVPEHILANAREGVYGTGRIVQDDYEMEIHENLLTILEARNAIPDILSFQEKINTMKKE
ncbi:MAG: hypothetical protein IKL09_08140 [Clostridia bacterium]|nr:hypothetical protein [Clostridia bacterium]